jgi:eukaryotic translation initiation factor 2C
MQVWTGYSQSLRAGDGVLTLNVDMACTAFLEQDPVLKFLTKAAGVVNESGLANMTPVQLRKAQKAISGLKVLFQS